MEYEIKIKEFLNNHLPNNLQQDIGLKLETPPDPAFGDFAFPCFPLAKVLKKSPQLIAHDLSAKLQSNIPSFLEKISSNGPYVNFFLNKKSLSPAILQQIQEQKEKYGASSQKQTLMIEFSSPNTNKPLHLGHVRNISLGDSISRIFSFLGNRVIKACLVNDRGIHICKSMLAYKKWGHNKLPDKKSDFFVGDFYILFSQKAKEHPELEEEAREMLRLWEKGDKETVALWKKMNQWVYDGFEKTYARLSVTFDRYYYESDIYLFGKEIVLEGLKKGVFVEKEGAVIAVLEDVGLPNKVLIRSDGTTIYITQDIYLAWKKFQDYPLQRSVYIVASEQNLHFQQLFAILKKLEYSWASGCYHLSYGMVLLPEGKMKSREGTVVDADTLMSDLFSLAKEEIHKRHPNISHHELEKRSRQVSLAALKFHMLKIDAVKDLVYNQKEAISFEGETGPYIQYTHARICSILRKAGSMPVAITPRYSSQEAAIISQLEKFPAVIIHAAEQYKPSQLCRYLLDLSQAVNSYYHEIPILQASGEEQNARLLMISSIRIVLENGLRLLGIEAPEEM